jgi:hypothetical protein
MDRLVDEMKQRGVAKPVEMAAESLATEWGLQTETLQQYVKEGAKLLSIHDAGTALHVHELAERLASEGAPNPLRMALEQIATQRESTVGVLKRQYQRGKRFILKNVTDPPEFK